MTAPPSDAARAAAESLVAVTEQDLPAGSLLERLALAEREGRPLRVKLGIDPSGTELTLGHAVVLRLLRRFQDLGHLAVLIIGETTGTIGDPSQRAAVRSALSAEQTRANATTYVEQVMRVLRPDRVEIRRNSEWLAPMTLPDVLTEARELTVARLLERDDFARRFAAGRPISLVEFLYPLLQGYDSVAVAADVEIGGTDQTYNLLVGRDLQRAHGQPQQVVLTVPLLEGLDGVQKMSKSLGNYVAIDEPPAEQFGKLMSIPDALVARYARLCTDLPAAEIERLAAAAEAGGPGASAAKKEVAAAVVALYSGNDAAQHAQERFEAVHARHELPADLPGLELPVADPVHLPALLVHGGLAASTSAARRLVDDGAVRVGGATVAPRRYDLPRADLAGQVLAAGRRRMVQLGT